MTNPTTLPNIEDLSYACIDDKPIDYEFSGERYAVNTEDGSGWLVCYGSIVPEDLELVMEVDGYTLELDLDTYEIEVSEAATQDWSTCHPYDDDYDKWAKHFNLDGDDARSFVDGEDDAWMPMMNYAYPLDREPPEDWKTRVNNCTCVEIDGNYYLALTGGGMDLSWEICESYMNLGYFPPAHFANLPQMAGRGTSERDKWIIEGCRKSLKGMQARSMGALDDLDRLVEWAKEDEPQ